MVIEPWVWAVLLLVLGLGLAALEIFIPSGGILGFLSGCAMVASVVVAFRQGSVAGVAILAVAVVGLPVVIVAAFSFWPQTAMGRRILLMAPKSEEVLPDDPHLELLKSLVGQAARAKCDMFPGGAIVADGRTIDAVSEGMPINAGDLVRVIEVRGTRVVVRRIESEGPSRVADDPLASQVEDPFEEEPPA